MQIAQVLAGFTLGGADLLRRAMGKKKHEEMAKQRALFAGGAVERGVDRDTAEYIFDLMEKFAGYGFNKSHSAAYALVSYHTAWLKAHYPAAFMAATMTADIDNTDKVVSLRADALDLGLEVLPPDVNACGYGFRPVDDGRILYGVGALKGVGRGVIDAIVEEREASGAFEDLFDFCRRVDGRKVNKRVIEALIKSGAMDGFDSNRAALMADVEKAMRAAGQEQSNLDIGQSDMFGVSERPLAEVGDASVQPWSEEERLAGERDTLGIYLTGHPYDRFRDELSAVADDDIRNLDLATPRQGVFAGLVVALRVLNTRRGKMAFVALDNGSSRIEVSLFSDKIQRSHGHHQEGRHSHRLRRTQHRRIYRESPDARGSGLLTGAIARRLPSRCGDRTGRGLPGRRQDRPAAATVDATSRGKGGSRVELSSLGW